MDCFYLVPDIGANGIATKSLVQMFTYDTYQDVRRNLFRYSTPVLVAAGFFAYFFVLPLEHRCVVVAILEKISKSQPWTGILGSVSGVGVFVGLAFLMTELIQIHDQWYDKYVIKWRSRYDTDYILPRLIQPFANRLNYRFHEIAEEHDLLKELFYPFVGDRDLRIKKNALVRFYEVVTVYWLTQINEIVLVLVTVLIAIYRFQGPSDVAYRTLLLNDLIFLGVLFLFNRAWARASIGKVRHATEDEIRGIHDDPALKRELEQRLIRAGQDYGFPYQ